MFLRIKKKARNANLYINLTTQLFISKKDDVFKTPKIQISLCLKSFGYDETSPEQ